jgi:hypothetical protein
MQHCLPEESFLRKAIPHFTFFILNRKRTQLLHFESGEVEDNIARTYLINNCLVCTEIAYQHNKEHKLSNRTIQMLKCL